MNKQIEKKYKIIEIVLNRDIWIAELNVIDELKKLFSNDDFFFKTKKNKVIFNLKSIDLDNFKNRINQLIKNHYLDQKYNISNSKNLFSEIIKRIENIKSYGIKSGKRVYIGYNRERKVKNRKNKILQRGSYYYAIDSNFTKDVNILPEKFVDKIICGDSKEVLKELPHNCIDLVFTSPPYNFGLDYDTSTDDIDWNKYFNKLFVIFKECIRVLKYGGRIIVNIQPLFSDYIPIHHIISDFFMKNKLIWKGEILWEKHNYNCKYTAWGSWKSPSSPYLKYTWEFLEIFCKGSLKKRGLKENIDITSNEFKDWVNAKWDIAPERNMKKYAHPAMFPEKLVYRVLKLFSYKGDIILDPFNGVGSTTAVARRLNRRYLGIDISKEYCQKAKKRTKETLF